MANRDIYHQLAIDCGLVRPFDDFNQQKSQKTADPKKRLNDAFTLLEEA
ncbi:MAG: hypothetical protein MPW17_05145 [Candidatus Manganitrophus sp.]|nr:hypothetical protein [Candidatus Manganitrophus sp.]WDT72223.1 MAG: hypothetical protein MPW17_05145 [Candidatus Manganitrophus sp.]